MINNELDMFRPPISELKTLLKLSEILTHTLEKWKFDAFAHGLLERIYE